MLFYYLFWMITGFIIHFYITFGTNLLTGGPTHIAVLLHVSVFRRKGISNGVQMEWNLRKSYFWNRTNPRNLECKPGDHRGGHEIGGAPTPWARPTLSWPPRLLLDFHSNPLDHVRSKNHAPEGFIPFGLRLIFLFFETLKQGKKTGTGTGLWVNKLVLKLI